MSFIFFKLVIIFLVTYNVVVIGALTPIAARWITSSVPLGPIYHIFCGSSFQCEVCIYSWSLSNTTIASNGALIGGDASRFSVKVDRYLTSNSVKFYGDILEIRNALKTDLGVYECHVRLADLKGSVQINILPSFYLPPTTYPECNISPFITLENVNVTFACTPGESKPPVKLSLVLQRQDGSVIHLGNESTTRQVTLEDNNATFICHMTSETFPTAYRNCSVSSLTVIQITTTAKATTSPSAGSIENKNLSPPYGTVGGIIGAVLIVLILIVIAYILIKRIKSKESAPSEIAINDNEQDGRASNQDNVNNPTIVQATGHIPLYSVVNKRNNSEENPSNTDEPTYEDTNVTNPTEASNSPIYSLVNKGDKTDELKNDVIDNEENQLNTEDTNVTYPTEASNSPIYSQVNKGYKTDESWNEISDNEGSGMVENTIYVSAGPK